MLDFHRDKFAVFGRVDSCLAVAIGRAVPMVCSEGAHSLVSVEAVPVDDQLFIAADAPRPNHC